MADTDPTTSTVGSTPTPVCTVRAVRAAVMDRPRERTVIHAGRVVAEDGTLR